MADVVSIVVPVHNAMRWLDACVASVVAQSHPGWQLILCDDGSTDGSAAACDRHAAAEPRILALHGPNQGPAAARNAGLDRVTGDFVLFLDADDELAPDALERLLAAQREADADLVKGDFLRVVDGVAGAPQRLLDRAQVFDRAGIADCARRYLARPNRFLLMAHSWGAIFRAAIIRAHGLRFDPGLRTFEDVSFNWRFLAHAQRLAYVDAPLYRHLVHNQVRRDYASASMALGRQPLDLFGHFTGLLAISDFLRGDGDPRPPEAIVGHACVTVTIIMLVRICGQLDDGNRALIHATIRAVVRQELLRASLAHYAPAPGESRLLPWLFRLRLVGAIARVCQRKAEQRYGTKKAA
jgi:glycosyltransferase involved in cell wall biosynthesis